jgi:cytoskeletal protein CcmA (bactofilin family)
MDFSFEVNTLCRFITVQLSRLFQNNRIFLLLAICSIQLLQAQVGIGTAQPEPSAMLDIRANGNHKGLLIPRITTAEKNSITAPAEGLIIYQTDGDAGFYFFNGQDWKNSGGVTSINGLTPSNNGELTLNVPKTQIGTEADRIATTNPTDGLLHIVDGDSNAQNNGRVYVYSALLADWTLTTNFIDTDTDTDTDNQSISGSSFNALTNELTIGIEDGNAQVVNLSGLSGTGTDSQTITAALVGNTLELLPQNTTTSVSVDLSSLAVTPTLEAVSAAGSSTTSTLVLSSVLPINSSVTIGNASNPWNSLNAQTTLSEHVSSTTVSASNISVAQFIRHDNDPDTYLLYNPDDIRFVSGGVDTVKILPNEVSVNDGSAALDFRVESDNKPNLFFVDGSSDNIGIGTPNPLTDVHLYDSFPRITLEDSDNTDDRSFIDQENGILSLTSRNNTGYGDIAFRRWDGTNGEFSMYIKSDGNVGVGTTSPSTSLEVNGTTSSTILVSSSLGSPTEMVFVGPNKHLSSTPSVTITASGELVVTNVVSATDIRVSGTISTTSDLFVEGDTRLEGDLTTTDADIVFEDTGGSFPTSGKGFFWRLNNDKAKIYAEQPSSDKIDFVFYLDDNAGNDNDKYIFYNRDHNGDSNSRYPLTMSGRNFYVYAPPSGSPGDPDLTSWAMRVEPNGNVDISGNLTVDGNGTFGGTVTSSDRRLKSNIIESNFGLNEIMRLSPKIYNKYKSTKKEQLVSKEIGFIAQEVKGIIPELVSFIGEENNLYGISYDMLIPVLTKAIQEQQMQIEALKRESKAMEVKYNDLLKEVQKIKAWIQSSEAKQ